MVTSNRSIQTKHSPQQEGMKLRVLRDVKSFKKGAVIEVSKSEARRLMATLEKAFEIVLD